MKKGSKVLVKTFLTKDGRLKKTVGPHPKIDISELFAGIRPIRLDRDGEKIITHWQFSSLEVGTEFAKKMRVFSDKVKDFQMKIHDGKLEVSFLPRRQDAKIIFQEVTV